MLEILIQKEHWKQMRADVIERAPQEACGLVAGLHNHSHKVFAIINALHSQTRYRLDPQQQLDAFLFIEDNGWDLLAIYHSHPSGPSYPSATDIEEAAYPDTVHLIWFPHQGGWSCRAFTIDQGMSQEIPLVIIDRSEDKA